MEHARILHSVRRLVRRGLAELGADPHQELSERILLREDHYCGRRFCCGALQAVWFIEEDEIKFYGPSGAVMRVSAASETAEPEAMPPTFARRAA